MKTLLQINASMFADGGQSTQLADGFVAAWRAGNPGAKLVVRDLGRAPIPHLTAERFGAFLAKAEDRTREEEAVARFSDALIAELQDADVIVIGLPMYNFGVPSTLKSYFDHIARSGITFRYTPEGPVGMLSGKEVYVFATRGGLYAGTPLDTQTAYVRDFLRFLGMDQVEFVYAEGLNIDAARKGSALAEARKTIGRLASPRAMEPLAA
jgi:FMN-dependent NADH-azoreductase